MTDNLPATTDSRDIHLIARHPAEMEQCQEQLIAWARRRETEAKAELDDCLANREIARKSKWRVEPWQRRVRAAGKTLNYYKKLRMALEAGYYIVPPMPFQAFAIRTERHQPLRKEKDSDLGNFDQPAQSLPAGEGRYVSPTPILDARRLLSRNPEGKDIWRYHWFARWFQEVDFPFQLVKPEILDAASKAMAAKVFDQIGILPNFQTRASDPMVAGQIIGPKRTVTFFIGWWLDTRDL